MDQTTLGSRNLSVISSQGFYGHPVTLTVWETAIPDCCGSGVERDMGLQCGLSSGESRLRWRVEDTEAGGPILCGKGKDPSLVVS